MGRSTISALLRATQFGLWSGLGIRLWECIYFSTDINDTSLAKSCYLRDGMKFGMMALAGSSLVVCIMDDTLITCEPQVDSAVLLKKDQRKRLQRPLVALLFLVYIASAGITHAALSRY